MLLNLSDDCCNDGCLRARAQAQAQVQVQAQHGILNLVMLVCVIGDGGTVAKAASTEGENSYFDRRLGWKQDRRLSKEHRREQEYDEGGAR